MVDGFAFDDYRKHDLKMAMVGQPWDYDESMRWLKGAVRQEIDWRLSTEYLGSYPYDQDILDREFRLNDRKCFDYQQRCPYIDICWEKMSIEERLERGWYVERKPNHPQEAE